MYVSMYDSNALVLFMINTYTYICMNVSLLLSFLRIAESVYVGPILVITHTAYVVEVSPSPSPRHEQTHIHILHKATRIREGVDP